MQMKEVVVGAAITSHGRLLLVQQRKTSALGQWSLPGGHVETGETHAQALRREVKEEVGLEVTSAALLQIDRRPDGFEHHGYAAAADGPISLAQDELLGFGWFSLAEIEQISGLLRAPFVLEIARRSLPPAPIT